MSPFHDGQCALEEAQVFPGDPPRSSPGPSQAALRLFERDSDRKPGPLAPPARQARTGPDERTVTPLFNEYDYDRQLTRRLKAGDTFGQDGLEPQLPPMAPRSAGLALRLLVLFAVTLLLTVILLVIAGRRGHQEAGWTWDDGAALVKAGA